MVTGMYVEDRRRTTSSREEYIHRTLYAWRNPAIFLELLYSFPTLYILVNLFYPFILFPSDEPYVRNDGRKTYYSWGEFLVITCQFLPRGVYQLAVAMVSQYPRGEALLVYLA